MAPLVVVILAAGQGTRMKSNLPKVLHPLAGRALVEHAVLAAQHLGAGDIRIVYGHGGERVPEALASLPVGWWEQKEQLGTGHAVEQAMPGVDDKATVLVLYGDVPLVKPSTLEQVVECVSELSIGLLTVKLSDPTGYGRIVRDDGGRVTAIVEQKDATAAERRIDEINTGILAVPAARLQRWLGALEANNAQGEFYLTDIIGLAVGEGLEVRTVSPDAVEEVLGVNDRVQLAQLERYYQLREAERLMRAGVSLADPARLDVRGEIEIGQDVSIDVNVVLEGRVSLSNGVRIGPNVLIRDVEIGAGSQIFANSVLEQARVGADCRIGPFARIRPGAELADGVHVGNYVEIKNSTIAEGSKINHLSYVGDSEVGSGVNVGAGTITCNYDGANKHRTVIGDGAFIGSGTELVAPVTVGAGATIGAGSTINKEAPPGQLTVARARQMTIEDWERPKKKS